MTDRKFFVVQHDRSTGYATIVECDTSEDATWYRVMTAPHLKANIENPIIVVASLRELKRRYPRYWLRHKPRITHFEQARQLIHDSE